MKLDAIIVAHVDDYHARAVMLELEKLDKRVRILDSADFPVHIKLEHFLSRDQCSLRIFDDRTNEEYLAQASTGVWWRRPRGHSVSSLFPHPKLAEFASEEARQAFLGSLVNACGTFINPVANSRYACLKPAQLNLAKQLGFLIPETCITNDPAVAADFVRRDDKRHVYKLFTGTDFGFYETRLFESDEDISELWRVRNCPMIIQEYIDGVLDLRATVIGNQVFCAGIDFRQGKHKIDCRVERNPTYTYLLEEAVCIKLASLVRAFGLIYGAIDLRLLRNGDIVFLEINPEGQYLWTEIEADLGISRALASALVDSGSQPGIRRHCCTESSSH